MIATNPWRKRRKDKSTIAIAIRNATIPVLVANQLSTLAIDKIGSCWKRANHARRPAGGAAPNAGARADPSTHTAARVAPDPGPPRALRPGGASPRGGPGAPP